ncbi:MAG: TAXI family TRAP transporter solute-binding subunit [Hyphomicrobiaceae bacterium]
MGKGLAYAMTAAVVGHLASAGTVLAKELKLPPTLVTTAYNTGTSGYSQMVAIGSMLKNKHGVNLRVLPGKNDVSRLSPVRKGTAQFTATGSDSVYAQEAVYTFGKKAWGPMPIRLVLLNRSAGCTSFAVAKDTGLKSMADLKGKRVAWVRGSPALQKATEALLAFANLTLDDVNRIEVGGWAASINGIINGDIDAAISATQSTFMLKMEASPRGVTHPPMPHSDKAGWARTQQLVPWYVQGICTKGVGIPGGRQEGIASIYPILVATTATSDDVAYGMTKAMIDGFEDYKSGAPGAEGWHIDQQLEDFYLPWHPGSVNVLKEAGKWTDNMQAQQDKMLKRQDVLLQAWKAYKAKPADDFDKGWMTARAAALEAAGMPVIFTAW